MTPLQIGYRMFDRDQDGTMDCWKSITTAAEISSPFPVRYNGGKHNGIDFTSETENSGHGAPVRSLATGYISEVGYDQFNGNYVRVAQADGHEATYIHLLDHSVVRDEAVSVGQQIGRMNCTGKCGFGANFQTVGATHVHVQIKDSSGEVWDAADLYGGEQCTTNTSTNPPPGTGTGGGPGGGGGTCTGYMCTIEP